MMKERSEQQGLRCSSCGRVFTDWTLSACQCCGGILLAEYSQEKVNAGQKVLSMCKKPDGIKSFAPVLPDIESPYWVSLRECGTPYLMAEHLEEACGVHSLWLKDETRNPTGSFKDRAIALCISMARQLKYDKVAVASSGNGAASVSAYAARAGVEAMVVVPETTPDAKMMHAQICGAKVVRVSGSFERSFAYAGEIAARGEAMNLTTTFQSPVGVEGYKTIAYEIAAQATLLPDVVVVPTGAGPVLYGIYKGFLEMKQSGTIARIPRMAAVQSKGCAPIVRAWDNREKVVAWEHPTSVASAISDPLKGYENNGDFVLDAVYNSGGFAIAVDDCHILDAGRLLAAKEGIFTEPASAAALAGVREAKKRGLVADAETVAIILTGSGLKDVPAYQRR